MLDGFVISVSQALITDKPFVVEEGNARCGTNIIRTCNRVLIVAYNRVSNSVSGDRFRDFLRPGGKIVAGDMDTDDDQAVGLIPVEPLFHIGNRPAACNRAKIPEVKEDNLPSQGSQQHRIGVEPELSRQLI
jgi:hypothetical protein